MNIETLDQIKLDIISCSRCGLCVNNTYAKKVPPDVNINAEGGVLIVGEGPGRHESNTGVPFVGESGQLLKSIVAKYNLSDVASYANSVCCRPPNNRTPTKEECQCCLPFLERLINTLHPRVIIATGATATYSVVGYKAKISKMVGSVIELPNGAFVVPCPHPAAAVRSGRFYNSYWYASIDIAFRIAKTIYDSYDEYIDDSVVVAESKLDTSAITVAVSHMDTLF